MDITINSLFLRVKENGNDLLLLSYNNERKEMYLNGNIVSKAIYKTNPTKEEFSIIIKRALYIAKENNLFNESKNKIVFLLDIDLTSYYFIKISCDVENSRKVVMVNAFPSMISYNDMKENVTDLIISLLESLVEDGNDGIKRILINFMRRLIEKRVAEKENIVKTPSIYIIRALNADKMVPDITKSISGTDDQKKICSEIANALLRSGVPLIYDYGRINEIVIDKDTVLATVRLHEENEDLERMLNALQSFT